LRWATWLQRLMFSPLLRTRPGSFIFQSKTVWGMMFAKTR
jgi:hypothetical protein